ncbi:hypothetical protein RISK_004603 [Rhodopirellula islandica]|uniref:Uncharacterized protein n=1 Tax=Rhodopirellula islandica TaxID=595434 RepID=A0A0J1B9Y6_RHOIS|nr:hypothetical protein RISK_004603 [Rhodopirellula islandica]
MANLRGGIPESRRVPRGKGGKFSPSKRQRRQTGETICTA